MTMPRLSALADDFAERFNFEPTKVASLARVLREAGMLSQKGRGNSAAQATALDAARLVIAMMLNSKMATAAEDVRLVGGFTPLAGKKFSDHFAPQTLEAAISGIVEYYGIKPVSDHDQGRYDGFRASVRLIPHNGLATAILAQWDEDKEDWVERDVGFAHPSLAVADLLSGADLPADYLATLRRFPAGFNQEPELDNRALFAIGQVVAGHKPLHWRAV